MATNLPETGTASQNFISGYYTQPPTMNPDVYNQVLAFFRSKTESDAAAQKLAQTVMILTYNNSLDPIKVIKDFSKAASESEYKVLLITFFNSTRGNTSKVGYNNFLYQNKWVQRNILA